MIVTNAEFAKVLKDAYPKWFANENPTRWRCDICGEIHNLDVDAFICCGKVSPVRNERK